MTVNGVQARYDGEGICRDRSIIRPAKRGWWIASEGNASSRPEPARAGRSATAKSARDPAAVRNIDAGADPALGGTATSVGGRRQDPQQRLRGRLPVATNGRYLYAPSSASSAARTRPARSTPASPATTSSRSRTAPRRSNGLRYGGDWDFFFYEFDSNDADNWAGLSEIICLPNGKLRVIERDKGIGAGSTLKKVYQFSVAGLTPDTDGQPDAGSDTGHQGAGA